MYDYILARDLTRREPLQKWSVEAQDSQLLVSRMWSYLGSVMSHPNAPRVIAFHMLKQGLWTYSVTSADQPTHRFQFCAAEKSSFLTCTIALADLAPSRCQVTRPDGHVQPFPTVDSNRGDGLPYLTMVVYTEREVMLTRLNIFNFVKYW